MNNEEIGVAELTETLVGPATPPGPEIVKLTELGLKVNDCARAVSG